MTISEQEHRKDKLCWSVFASASSSVSIAGLLLYISGIRNFGAILLSFGIQVLVIAFLFYCWTRCWRRIKPDEKASDPPPPYKNEWRIAFFTPMRFIEGSAQASSGLSERVEPVTVMKIPDSKIQHSESSAEASASSNPAIELRSQRRDDHAVPMEHSATEIGSRRQISPIGTSSSWRIVNLVSEPSEISGMDLFYKTHPEAHYMPINASNNLDLPSYEEAVARFQVDDSYDNPPI